jgi:hypothetical protein
MSGSIYSVVGCPALLPTDLDDEAMFRIEPKIAEYLRAAADEKRGAREAAEALAALRFKALTLLEVYARKVRVNTRC